MKTHSLTTLCDQHLEQARSASSGRSAVTLDGGPDHRLRQTLIALAEGRRLGEHESPGDATLQVLRGDVRLHAGAETWSGSAGDLVEIPPVRHDLEAAEDAVVLLTVVLGSRDS